MANQGRRPRGASKGTSVRRAKTPQRPPKPKKQTVVFDAPTADAEEPRTFRLGVVPGTTPGKWIDAWKERMPKVPLEPVQIEVAGQRAAIDELDAALVRLPLSDDSLHIVTLYDEIPVVVAAIDSHLLIADELTLADLAGEVLMILSDDVLVPFEVPGAVEPSFAPLRTADAVATAATGAGIAIVPMSVARMHQRKDADYRPLADGPISTVALAWPRDRTTPDVETFFGIVRGRTANSSR